MSCVCILTPVVIAAWPAFSAAVAAAATSLGYQVVSDVKQSGDPAAAQTPSRKVALEIAQSELVTDQLGRDQRIRLTRDGVIVTFSRDERGQASLCVEEADWAGRSKEELQAIGEELSQRVVQKYVYQRLMDEMRAREFVVVEEEAGANHTIRLKVRHWEN
jgi:hypothetical protein